MQTRCPIARSHSQMSQQASKQAIVGLWECTAKVNLTVKLDPNTMMISNPGMAQCGFWTWIIAYPWVICSWTPIFWKR
ncbi:MAG: hypothetical protein RID09_10680 [Coleofasciculus sp. G1-WW12-02]|uniref:hypothetical protein n=1 Tax=Coleofasciculus sp. G1-WW12-02 TaxID=3068483 RepID=UPI0032F3D6F1